MFNTAKNVTRVKKVFIQGASAVLTSLVFMGAVQAKTFFQDISTEHELAYRTVLYEYFQDNHFQALVEQAYLEESDNQAAFEAENQLFKGGLQLTYGLGDQSKVLFDYYLASDTPKWLKDQARFYLAKYFYQKSNFAHAATSLNLVESTLKSKFELNFEYLSVLLQSKGHKITSPFDPYMQKHIKDPKYPYWVFNTAVVEYQSGKRASALEKLNKVAGNQVLKSRWFDPSREEEYLILSDRAKHAIAQIHMKEGDYQAAWDDQRFTTRHF